MTTTTDFKVLEQNHPRVDAYDKVTGRATYASDVYLPGMLACKLLPSTRNHARIVSLDISQAEALPGVRAVITGVDFPEVRYGSGALRDRYVMPREVVNLRRRTHRGGGCRRRNDGAGSHRTYRGGVRRPAVGGEPSGRRWCDGTPRTVHPGLWRATRAMASPWATTSARCWTPTAATWSRRSEDADVDRGRRVPFPGH